MSLETHKESLSNYWTAWSDRLFNFLERADVGPNSILLGLAVIVGVGGGYGQLGFHYLIHFFQDLTFGNTTNIIDSLYTSPWFKIVLVAAIGGLLVGFLVHYFAPEAKGHGVPSVMEAVALKGGKIRPRVMFVKALASAITLSTGGAVGREGPIVQIGSSCGSTIGQVFRVSRYHLRVLVACGAAAGIASTFNAPMAGVLFAVEVILGEIAIASFSPLVVSAVVATLISHNHLGDKPIFIIPHYTLHSGWEIVFYIVLGILSSLAAILYSNALYASEDFFDNIKIPLPIKAMIGMAIVGCILIIYPQVFGGGYQAITEALHAKLTPDTLIALFVVNIIASSITLGCGGSGGVFAPSLFIGAMLGGTFGKLAASIAPNIVTDPGAYAVVGMGAVVSAATRAPLTAILIIFEMTTDYHIIMPLMFACIISTVVHTWLSKDSIYTKKLSRNGINLNSGLETQILNATPVAELMHTEISTIPQTAHFKEVLELMLSKKAFYHYVFDQYHRLVGMISLEDIKEVLGEYELDDLIIAGDMMNDPPPTVFPSTSLADCYKKFGARDLEELPVLSEDGQCRILGVIRRHDLMGLYSREILFQGSVGLKLIKQKTDSQKSSYVDIPDNHEVQSMVVCHKLAGKSLRDLDIRKKFGVNVVAIKTGSGIRGLAEDVPNPSRPLKRSDVLVMVGPLKQLNEFKKFAHSNNQN